MISRRVGLSAAGALLLFGLFGSASGGTAALVGAGTARAALPRPAAAVVAIHPTSIRRFASATQPPTQTYCLANFDSTCYDPAQIQAAYDEQPLFDRGITGRGQTIVIVDSFGSPTIRADLATFDHQFGLPAPPSFRTIQPAGALPPYDPTNADVVGWAGETTLDVEWSHAIAPGANILLVETPVSETEGVTGFPQIVEAENYVIDHHLGGVISQSFSATEETFPTVHSLMALRGAYINAYLHGVTVLAASGDSGAADVNDGETVYYLHPVTSWPDSDPLVTGVGGTQLQLDIAGNRTAPDQVWNDTYNTAFNKAFFGEAGPLPDASGGGKSVIFRRPWYQNGVAAVTGDQRGVPDISMSGSCTGAVDTYESFEDDAAANGWYVACGTSEATPMFAGIVALADQVAGHPLGLINPALYRLSSEHASGIVDVTQGNNTVSFRQHHAEHTVQGFDARPGYDLASGVGTVNAARFVPELAWAARPWVGRHRHHHRVSRDG